MSTTESTVLDPEDLNPTDRAILDELREGRVTPAYVAEVHGYTSGNVRNRMTNLAQHEHVRALGGGLYELIYDPRRSWVQECPPLVQEFIERCDLPNEHMAIATSFERGVEMIEATASADDLPALTGALLFWAIEQYEDYQRLRWKTVEAEAGKLLRMFGYEDIQTSEDS